MKELVYGIIQDNVVFANKHQAIQYASITDAIPRSKNWADFIRLTSQETYEEVMYRILEVLEYEQLFPHFLMGESLSNYVPGLALPLPDDEFSVELLPGFEDGEFFPRFEEEIISWLPEDIFLEMGKVEEMENDAFRYRILPDSLPLVIQSLEALGFSVEENTQLILKAQGNETPAA
jgi:hypothetical protein